MFVIAAFSPVALIAEEPGYSPELVSKFTKWCTDKQSDNACSCAIRDLKGKVSGSALKGFLKNAISSKSTSNLSVGSTITGVISKCAVGGGDSGIGSVLGGALKKMW